MKLLNQILTLGRSSAGLTATHQGWLVGQESSGSKDAVPVAAMRIDCPSEEVLFRYLKQELSPEQERAVEVHVNSCPNCQRPLERLIQFAGPALSTVAPSGVPSTTFPGYQVLAAFPRGGMGFVYKVRDLKRQSVVALKTMNCSTPDALRRFKCEFRALQGISHENLVSLYDLVASADTWFFTMELVEGAHFLDALGTGQDRLHRLRTALLQLAEGLSVLHRAGKVHRDLKPSNVLVTPASRVVILDFGLVTDLGASALHQSTHSHLLGTVPYMSPEQAARKAVSPATDWYSVGVMLYEALTNRLPFEGSVLEVLQQKQQREPTHPGELVDGLPGDLQDLCMALLRRCPEERPTAEEVIRQLSGPTGEGSPNSPRSLSRANGTPFVGREEQRSALRSAFCRMKQGHTVAVYIHGRSGVGKTALLQCFLEELPADAVVLAGRCYEQESVPFKAFDYLVDGLSRYLSRLPLHDAQVLLPREVQPLTRLFPVLRQVKAVVAAPQPAREIPDPLELRRRAFGGMRELLARVGDRHPLVLVVDDLQWGDPDSAALLIDLLRLPDSPNLMFVGCYRSENVSSSHFLREFFGNRSALGSLDQRELVIEPLTDAESRQLAVQLLELEQPNDYADRIARESGGSPIFIQELANRLRTRTEQPPEGQLTLDSVVWNRVEGLPHEVRRSLEALAVAGRPTALEDACRAAAIPSGESRRALAVLRAHRLIRSNGGDQQQVEIYHDRIRETVLAHLDGDTVRQHHVGLATVLEQSGQADPEILGIHLEGAGDLIRAARYYVAAADHAAETLAFDRAAKLYRHALQLHLPTNPEELRRLQTQLGDALANAGRGAAAAETYRMAASDALAADSLELRRRAATQLLISGRVDDGVALLRSVLADVGLKLPETPRGALWSLLWRRAQLWFRGTSFRPYAASDVPRAVLRLVDICWCAGLGLSAVDPIRGFDFQTRSLLLALRAGEPYRIACGLAMEGVHVATGGRPKAQHAAKLLESAEALAKQIGNPHALGLVSMAKGLAAYLQGYWQRAQELCDQAEAILRERCTGVAWELDTAQIFAVYALYFQGDLAEHRLRLMRVLQEASQRGDLYVPLHLGTFNLPFVRMVADAPEQARQELDSLLRQWAGGFHVEHINGNNRQVEIDLYMGHGRQAWERLAWYWPALSNSLLLRIQHLRIYSWHLRARAALAAAWEGGSRADARFLRSARRDATRLEREQVVWARAAAHLVRAGICVISEQARAAVTHLRAALDGLENSNMKLYAAVTRRRLGQILGAQEGQRLIDQAESWMNEQGIANPARMSALLAPGFEESDKT